MLRPASPYVVLALLAASAALSGQACAQEQEDPTPTPEEVRAAESAPLFNSHELLEMTLEADFHAMRREDRSDEDSEERPAIMRWTKADGSSETQEIQIQTRGNFRLARRNCDFPPLRINVKTGPSKGTIFEGQDKLKLVVTCKLGQNNWEQYVLSEYLVYRMFNLFTPFSFRVRLARVHYIDTSGEEDPFTRFAFLIEDDDQMATRNGGRKVDWNVENLLNPLLIDKDLSILVEVFQYMIGNTDWSALRMHNMELIQRGAATYATVPFDFDFSGIVDARYARPDGNLGIRSVRQRLFRGLCPEDVNRHPDDYEAVYQSFRDRREAIYDLWRNQVGLHEKTVEETLDYLDEFFEILDDPGKIQSHLMDRCRPIRRP